ncbi:MAG TPA: YggT family protein [Candidatus Limnocylindria bacterium]|nr:YggT family protein [Candidatus Limnocylindria bacterium]
MPLVVVNFLQLLAFVLWLLIIARVVISWLMPMGGGGVVAFIYQATEPILAPIRRLIPPSAGIDWAPLIALLLLGALTQAVTGLH